MRKILLALTLLGGCADTLDDLGLPVPDVKATCHVQYLCDDGTTGEWIQESCAPDGEHARLVQASCQEQTECQCAAQCEPDDLISLCLE